MKTLEQHASSFVNHGLTLRAQLGLCLLVAFLFCFGTVPLAFSEPLEEQSEVGSLPENTAGLQASNEQNEFNVAFPSTTNSESDLQVVLNYSDAELFSAKSDTYNDNLGYASVCLASAAANSNTEEDYANKGKNIQAFLGSEGIGCKDVALNDGYSDTPLAKSNIGAAIGWKDISVVESGENKNYKLFAVGVRGIAYEAEWAGNLRVGSSGDHQGFAEARDSVLGFILPYIRDHSSAGDNLKIWIAGYSRGGAVCNLVGGWLSSWLKDSTRIVGKTPQVQYANTYNEALMRNTEAASYDLSGRNLSKGDIYCYCISVPQGVDKANIAANNQYCVGVHNLINPDDWIPQIGMSWWNFGRYGTDHDISSVGRSSAVDRDKPMLPEKAEIVSSMINRLRRINSDAAYSTPWFKQYYFSFWKLDVLEDTGGDGNKYISKKTELTGRQGRYFEEFGRFVTGAVQIDERSVFAEQYEADFVYLAKLLFGLSPENSGKLMTTFKAQLTQALREQLKNPELTLENLGANALGVLDLVLNKEQEFAMVCSKTLKGSFNELRVAYNATAVDSAAATLAKVLRLIVKADGQNFYHLLTVVKASSGIAQAHYPEVALAWWVGSDKSPVEPKRQNKVTLRFFDNIDDGYTADDDRLVFSRDIYEGDRIFFSNEEQPTIDGKPIDDGIVYYTPPRRDGYTFIGWETVPVSGHAEYSEFYRPKDRLFYGDFDDEDIQAGVCNLFAMWRAHDNYSEPYISLLKNNNYTLPFSGHSGNLVIIGCDPTDAEAISYAVGKMQSNGLIDANAYVVNLATGDASGSADSSVRVTIGCYLNSEAGWSLSYAEGLREAVMQANSVLIFSEAGGVDDLQPGAARHEGISAIMNDAHAAGAKLTLFSVSSPYLDAARYNDVDAIVCAFMMTDFDAMDYDETGVVRSYMEDIAIVLGLLFDDSKPTGVLPVDIPKLKENEDGTVSPTDEVLYEQKSGLGKYEYAFVEGGGAVYEQGSDAGLRFKANARHDKLVAVRIDGVALDASCFAVSPGSTVIVLAASYLDGLSAGEHRLEALYDYGEGQFAVSTVFEITTSAVPGPGGQPGKGAPAKLPKTGDATLSFIIIALFALAAFCIAFAVGEKRRGL